MRVLGAHAGAPLRVSRRGYFRDLRDFRDTLRRLVSIAPKGSTVSMSLESSLGGERRSKKRLWIFFWITEPGIALFAAV
jgi:hypothetical protein